MGYPVEACYVVLIKPRVRGGFGTAELKEYNYPFEAVTWALGLYHMKLAHDPYIKWYERTDKAAVEDEIKKDLDTKSRSEPEYQKYSDVQGRVQDTPDTSPSIWSATEASALDPLHVYRSQEGKQLLETIGKAEQFVEDYKRNHTVKPQEIRVNETSGHITDSQLDNQSVVVRFASIDKPRIVPETYELPSEIDISVDPELDLDSETSIPHKPRRIA
jgi:hypothetical protein